MCQPSQLYTGASSYATITTANPNLDGTGAMSSVLLARDNGTILQTVTIKATASNDQGMIRLFIQNVGGTKYLWREIPVPANAQSSTVPAYQTTLRAAFTMQTGDQLFASTQNNETWNVLAEAISWENCSCPS